MKLQLQRWGDDLAVCIPARLAAQLGIAEGTEFNISVMGGALILQPSAVPTLDELLASITDSNVQRAIDTGPAFGVETW